VLKFSVHRRSPPEEIPMLKKLALAAVALAAFMVQADAQQARLRVEKVVLSQGAASGVEPAEFT
jgi:hypothetical protein